MDAVYTNAKKGILIVAGYDDYDRMIKIDCSEGLEKDITQYEECAYIKAFLWDGVRSMKPLCECITIYLW